MSDRHSRPEVDIAVSRPAGLRPSPMGPISISRRSALTASRRGGLAAITLVIATVGLALGAGPAAAMTNHVVTTTADVVAADGQLSLREAISQANADGDDSTIVLGAGLHYELDLCALKEPYDTGTGHFAAPDDDDANLDGDLDHDAPHDLTIDGNGSTIEQTCAYDRVLHSMNPSTHLVIDDTTIRGGDDAPELGDNIRSLGSLTLQNDTVVRDSAPFNPGGYSVYVLDEIPNAAPDLTLTIDDSTITQNDENGAIIEYGTLVVDGATVTGNDGSGLGASFSTISVAGSTISGNVGTGIGGIDSSVDLSGSTVSGNGQGVSATGNTPGASPLIVTASTIDGNERGGLSCSYCELVQVTDSSITDNGSLDGPLGSFGGISMFSYDANVGVVVSGSTIAGNRTPGDGGAINARFVDEFGQEGVLPIVQIDDSDVYGNRSGIQADGGALYVERANVAIVNGSSFNDNRARPSDRLIGGDGGALWVTDAISVAITDSHLTANQASGDGGAVYATDVGQFRVERSLVADGRALGGGGGGLNLGTVVDIRVTDSSIIDNQSQSAGAGLRTWSQGGQAYSVDVLGSTVARNHVMAGLSGGGGVFASDDLAEVRMINSTVAHNTAFGPGAGVEVLGRGAVNLIHTTMVWNESTSGDVANLYHQSGPLLAWATVIAGGLGGGLDCGTFSGPVVSVGYNISGDNSCGFGGPTDKTGVVALGLGALGDNGGPTHTLKPSKNSPLVNVIPLGNCPKPTDQRGVARPVGARCDVGSVEVAGHGAGPGGYKNPGRDPGPPDDEAQPTSASPHRAGSAGTLAPPTNPRDQWSRAVRRG